jgi:hypothetical protein
MMTVDDVLRMAKSPGVAVQGYNLVLEYDANPPAQLLGMLQGSELGLREIYDCREG